VKQIKWKEPASFIRAGKRALGQGPNRRRQLIVFLSGAGGLALILGIGFVIGYYRHGFKGGSAPPVWIWPAIVFGIPLAIAYVIPWINSLTVAQIAVSPSGVYRTSREAAALVLRHWPWDTIAAARIEAAPLASIPYDGLRLTLHNGETILIGLNEKVDVDRLQELLCSAGKLTAPQV